MSITKESLWDFVSRAPNTPDVAVITSMSTGTVDVSSTLHTALDAASTAIAHIKSDVETNGLAVRDAANALTGAADAITNVFGP